MDISLLILVVIAILLGALVRNIFGFGEALVTMPLLSLLNIDFKLSVSIVAIIGILVAFPVFIKSRKDIDWSIIKRLLIGSIIGALDWNFYC
ncbi:TSUP family transporter [Mammaliicoccus lentus]